MAGEGRWIGGELPVDRNELSARVDRALTLDNVMVFVADIADCVVGTIGLVERIGIVEFGMMIDADHRGMGLGGQLLDAGLAWAKGAGAHKVALEAWTHNASALALYERRGFQLEGTLRRHFRRNNGELWDCHLMGLVLDHESPGSAFALDAVTRIGLDG